MEKTVLIVDDDQVITDCLNRSFARRGVKAYIANKGEDAVKAYQRHKPSCVFLDYDLPDINGVEVIKRIWEIDNKAKVYFVTGGGKVNEQQAKALGAKGVLTKPVFFTDLERLI